MTGQGRVYQRGEQFWLDYSVRGKRYREPGGETEQKAKAKLKQRLKEIYGDRFVGPSAERLTVEQLCDNLIADLERRGAKAVPSFRSHLKPIRDAFVLTRAVDLTTAHLRAFIQERQQAKKANATINREVGSLRQAFRLAQKDGLLTRAPYFPMQTEDNTRQGFFERADFEAVAAKLEAPIDDIALFGYLTGWRKGEILPLTWAAVDREAREITLADSKNGEPRTLGYGKGSDLDQLIERRWEARGCETRDKVTRISEYVFHDNGDAVVDFRKRWLKACKDAKVPGRLFHDLRRTAGRDMVRAGVRETVAMTITGHKTRAMFDRYNITDERDRREAQSQLVAYRSTLPSERKVEVEDMHGGA